MAKKKKDNWFKKLLKAVVGVYLLLIVFQLLGDAYSKLQITHEKRGMRTKSWTV